MKKYLLIFMGVLGFFFFYDSASALSYTATDGKEYTVDSPETLLDYCYYTYNFSSKGSFYLSQNASGSWYYCAVLNNENYYYAYYSNYDGLYAYSDVDTTVSHTVYSFKKENGNYIYQNVSTNSSSTLSKKLLFASNNVYNDSSKSSIFFSVNTSSSQIEGKYGVKNIYTITYYVNNEVYKTIEVEEGSSHELLDYTPPSNYKFNGWIYSDEVNLSNITSNIDIYGTTTYVRPDMNYSEDIDSIIHELSVSIIGKNVPVEFDYVYTIMDFILLLVLVFCVIMPFVIVVKLLSGRW